MGIRGSLSRLRKKIYEILQYTCKQIQIKNNLIYTIQYNIDSKPTKLDENKEIKNLWKPTLKCLLGKRVLIVNSLHTIIILEGW